jgi:hypothetical protein
MGILGHCIVKSCTKIFCSWGCSDHSVTYTNGGYLNLVSLASRCDDENFGIVLIELKLVCPHPGFDVGNTCLHPGLCLVLIFWIKGDVQLGVVGILMHDNTMANSNIIGWTTVV